MKHLLAIAVLALLAAGCASNHGLSSAVSHLDRGTAARLADEGAVPDRASAVGATGGELSGSAR